MANKVDTMGYTVEELQAIANQEPVDTMGYSVDELKAIAGQDNQTPVEQPSILKEFGKANEQVSGGLKNLIQARSGRYNIDDFTTGFKKPSKVPSFKDVWTTDLMQVLEKTPLKDHPNIEAQAYYALGTPLGLAGMVADSMTNPLEVATGVAIGPLLGGIAKTEIGITDSVMSKGRSVGNSLLEKMGVGSKAQILALKKEQQAVLAQTRFNASNIEEAAKLEVQAIDNSINKLQSSLKNGNVTVGSELDKTVTTLLSKKDSLLETSPREYARAAAKLKQSAFRWLKERGDKFTAGVDKALGGAESDIFLNPSQGTSVIEANLQKHNIPFKINESGKMIADGVITPGEQKGINLYNSIVDGDQLGIRRILRDKATLGKGYGKDMFLDDLLHDFVGIAKKEAPGLNPVYAEYAASANLKTRITKEFDLFNRDYSFPGQTSDKAQKMVAKAASGKDLTHNQKGLITQLKQTLPDFDEAMATPYKYASTERKVDSLLEAANTDKKMIHKKISQDIEVGIQRLEGQKKAIEDVSRSMAKSIRDAGTAEVEGKLGNSINAIQMKLDKLKKTANIIKYGGLSIFALAEGKKLVGYTYKLLTG